MKTCRSKKVSFSSVYEANKWLDRNVKYITIICHAEVYGKTMITYRNKQQDSIWSASYYR